MVKKSLPANLITHKELFMYITFHGMLVSYCEKLKPFSSYVSWGRMGPYMFDKHLLVVCFLLAMFQGHSQASTLGCHGHLNFVLIYIRKACYTYVHKGFIERHHLLHHLICHFLQMDCHTC